MWCLCMERPEYMNSNRNTCLTDVLTAWMLEEEGSENVTFLDGHGNFHVPLLLDFICLFKADPVLLEFQVL